MSYHYRPKPLWHYLCDAATDNDIDTFETLISENIQYIDKSDIESILEAIGDEGAYGTCDIEEVIEILRKYNLYNLVNEKYLLSTVAITDSENALRNFVDQGMFANLKMEDYQEAAGSAAEFGQYNIIDVFIDVFKFKPKDYKHYIGAYEDYAHDDDPDKLKWDIDQAGSWIKQAYDDGDPYTLDEIDEMCYLYECIPQIKKKYAKYLSQSGTLTKPAISKSTL